MASVMLQPGTKVKIKSFIYIKKTLNNDNYCGRIWFAPPMKTFCEREFKIGNGSEEDSAYILDGIPWNWHEKWFDVIDESIEYLNDGSIEQRSLCLALIRQTLVGNPSNLSLLINSEYSVFPITADGGFDYADFMNDNWCYTKKIAKNIPDWPCLKLKPEILEEKIKDYIAKYGLKCFEEAVDKNIISDHLLNNPDNKESWIDLWDSQSISWRQENEYLNSPFKTYDNEIKFQRKKGSIFRGTVPEGNQQSSGKCKAATCSGHLSYQVCSGR